MWVILGIMRPLGRVRLVSTFCPKSPNWGAFRHVGDFGDNIPIGACFASPDFSPKVTELGGLFCMWVILGVMRPLGRVRLVSVFCPKSPNWGAFLHVGDLGANAPIGAYFASPDFSPKVTELGGLFCMWVILGLMHPLGRVAPRLLIPQQLESWEHILQGRILIVS